MKYHHLLIFLILVISSDVFGQNTQKNRPANENNHAFRFTINTGVTFSNAFGKGTDKESNINGYPPDCYTNGSAGTHFILGKKIGIGFIKDLNDKFSIGLDINYEEKGSRIPVSFIWYEGKPQAIDEKSNIRLKYIALPLKLETRFKKMYVQSGIYAGVLLDADDYGTINGIYFERDKDSRYSRIDIGVGVGFGKRIPLSAKSILKLGINGNWSLIDNEARAMTPGDPQSWFNQSLNFEIRFERKIK